MSIHLALSPFYFAVSIYTLRRIQLRLKNYSNVLMGINSVVYDSR